MIEFGLILSLSANVALLVWCWWCARQAEEKPQPHPRLIREAFVVVQVNTENDPPTVEFADVYSEGATSLTAGHMARRFCLDVFHVSGTQGFSEARKRALRQLVNVPQYRWILRFLPREDKEEALALAEES